MTRTKLLTYSGNSTCIGRSVQHTVLTGTGSLYYALKKKLYRFLFYLCECACVFLFLLFCVCVGPSNTNSYRACAV